MRRPNHRRRTPRGPCRPIRLARMVDREHNPHQRRLYLPLIPVDATVGGAPVLAADPAQGHEARSVGCAQTARPARPVGRKPAWFKVQARTGPNYLDLKRIMRQRGLHTVCEEAGCPNIFECWEEREATFLILGERCTRRCDFCQIDTGRPEPLDRDEPRRVAESVAAMELRYATITGVARDDLPDEGVWLYAETVRHIHTQVPGCGVELLAPDFNARAELL